MYRGIYGKDAETAEKRRVRDMTCQRCGSVIPEDSKFCQICGSSLEPVPYPQEQEEMMEGPVPVGYGYPGAAMADEGQFPVEMPVPPVPDRKRKLPVVALVFLIVLPVLLVSSLAFNVLQYVQNGQLSETVEHQETTIQRQDSQISAQADEIAELAVTSGYYDTICQELGSTKAGYGSANFRTNEGIVVVRRSQTNRKITLITSWSGSGTVYTDHSGDAAELVFDENSWSSSTTLTVKPDHVGVTAVTFSNSRDSNTFKVLIIVTE